MRQLPGQRTRAIFALTLMILFLTNIPRPALAAAHVPGCIPNVGKKVPILMVPGFGGKASDAFYPKGWLQSVLDNVPGIYADSHGGLDTFDYSGHPTDWVNTAGTGQALEMKIACMAQSSREAGGLGKVIIIGYSMGGLLVRYAVNQTLNGESIADDVGYIINIAVPNRGVDLASAGFGMLKVVCAFKSIPLNGLLFKPPNQALATYCPLIPDIKDFETNLKSPTNSLPDIPVSIPVYDIEGNVKAPLSIIFQSFPTLGTDLLVSVLSAHSQLNILDNGLGGDLVVRCTALTPILGFFTYADCDHLGMVHDVPVEKEVVTQIGKYLDVIHPPCPVNAGTCLGIKAGDMDADRIPDRVGVTWMPGACSSGTPSSCQMVAHIVLDTGEVIDAPIPWNFIGVWNITSLQFMGLSDVNGDSRDEVFLVMSGNCGSCTAVVPYELHQGKLQPLAFPGAFSSLGAGLSIGEAGYDAGFTCRVVSGKHQVLTVSWPLGTNAVHEMLYQANSDGTESLIKQDTATYTTQQENALSGAHCPGLSVS